MNDRPDEKNRKLRKLWMQNVRIRDIAAEFNCSAETVRKRCRELKLTTRARKWLSEEEKILREDFSNGIHRSITAKKLERTIAALNCRAGMLKIKFIPIPSERLPKKEGHCKECACNPQSISVCCLPRCPHVTATEFYHERSLTGSSASFV